VADRPALPPYDAVVLAGGGARRLGGADKPAQLVGDRTLLDRVLAAVATAGTVVVVGPQRPVSRPVVWAREDPPGGGPAAALAAGLGAVEAGVVAVLAADLPFLDAATVDALRAAGVRRDGALLRDADGLDQVLAGIWSTAALRAAVAAAGDLTGAPLRRVLGGLDAARVVAGTGRALPPWFDCDTPEDLRRAREHA
jgi:molybdenum cofactor guanylyltransferase